MSISDAQYLDWLQTPNKRRVILCEYDYMESGTLKHGYCSNSAYVSLPSDTPANIAYDDVIVGDITYSRNMSDSLEGGASVSRGEITIVLNPDLQNLISGWFNLQSLNLFIGDKTWARNDFRKIVSGVAKEKRIDRDRLIISFRDDSELLNTPFKRTLVASGVSVGKNIPLCFGQCFNVTPLLVDHTTRKYQVHDGAVNDITDVRDNGVSVGFTKTNSTGTFVLTAAPAGQITCDVKGAAPSTGAVTGYKSTACDIVNLIMRNYAGFSAGDVDSTALGILNTAATYDCGLYIVNDNYTMIEAINGLLKSIGAFWLINRLGVFTVGRLQTPATSLNTLLKDEIKQFGLIVKKIIPPETSVKLGHKKNWTDQSSGLASSVSIDNKALYSTPYSLSSATDVTILSNYPDAKSGTDTETYLVNKSNCDSECARRINLVKVQRTVYEIYALTAAFSFNLGDMVDVTYDGFGFSSSKSVIVTSVSEKIGAGSSILEVWV
jgi:hypothetical protein